MNHTQNYQLSQWVKTDKVQMEDFNADNAKIDAALKAETDARTAAVASLSSSRNCQAVITRYTGTGTAGPNAPTSISFAQKPFFIHVGGDNDHAGFSAVYGQTAAICYSQGSHCFLQLTWSGNRVSWYETYSKATQQMNVSGQSYTVFALLSV